MPEADGEQQGRRATHNTSAFPTRKGGMCQLSSPLLPAHVWEQRAISTSAPCLAGKVGEPLCPRLPGSRGGSRIPGSAVRHMREGHLCRSCRCIITCWRTKEYAWKGKDKITTFWRGAGLHSQAMGKSQSHPVALPSPATMKKAVVWPLPPPHHHSLLILHLLLLLKQLLSMCRIR